MTATQKPLNNFHCTASIACKSLISHSIECLKNNHLLISLNGILLGILVLFGSSTPVSADFILTLKNGRTVHVEAYSENEGVIIFSSYGGEIRIAKEDVQSITPAVGGTTARLATPQGDAVPVKPPQTVPGEEKLALPGQKQKIEATMDKPVDTGEKVLTPEEIKAAEKAEEEKQYRLKVREVTARLKAKRDQFAVATRRTPGPAPSILDSQEAIRARTADLNSRLKDARRTPAGPSDRGVVRLEQPSPFTGAPPTIIDLKSGPAAKRVQPLLTPYSPKEKKLSLLRGQILALEKERDRLIQEMRRKNFNTASLFLE